MIGHNNINNKKEITFKELYNAFFTYKNILDRFNQNPISDGSYFIGYAIITSLICEIGLKALLIYEGKEYHKEHKLDKLFNNLNGEQQSALSSHFGISIDEFKNVLAKNNNHFINWRYFYEGNCNELDVCLIEGLIRILTKRLEIIQNNSVNQ